MGLRDLSDREAVLSTIYEFDKLGRENFLAKYGFGEARKFFLTFNNQLYDSKAIAGVAHGYQFPDKGNLKPNEFSGGEATVKKKLEDLDFTVINVDKREDVNYWALLANPNRYRILDAIRGLDCDLWTTHKSTLHIGDKVIIWQSLDHLGRRGIVALGEVIREPRKVTDEKNPYWIDPNDGYLKTPRTLVRYINVPSLPMWIGESLADEYLQKLNVARARGGTVFHVSENQWHHLLGLIGGWPGDSPEVLETQEILRSLSRGKLGNGQGIGLSQTSKRAVEEHAMNLAIIHFSKEYQSVTDVSSRAPYDLVCISGEEELHVEVKGTTTKGSSVLLTRNEVEHSRMSNCALFIVSNIELHNPDSSNPSATGGNVRIFKPWRAHDHELKPISYECILDETFSQQC